ncbi:MAG: tRNA 2-thiocytidine biosynthesis TtcA family protein [Firmicutes bacterium]|nr:tRNA 2-thiocytidine biosynthesis TtcA family protein [Bacillota bacterium]
MVDYNMVSPGDRIAVALSGGKDSAVLLYALTRVLRVSPVKFALQAIFIDLGWEMEISALRDFCESLGIPFYYKPSEIGKIVFEARKEKNPCALCSNLRRGVLNNTAIELGCNKVALGHHLDDAIETFFMSLFYNGQFRTFAPATYLDRSGLTMIRPLIYLFSEHVARLARELQLPVIENPCPASGLTKREEAKQAVLSLVRFCPEFKERFLNALRTADLRNLWLKNENGQEKRDW